MANTGRYLHIAVAQVHSGGTVDENLLRIERQAGAAAAVGADVVLFSECVLQGYGYEEDMNAGTVTACALSKTSAPCRQLAKLARELHVVILAGMFEVDGGSFYNSCLVACPDGSLDIERKHALTSAELAAGLTRGEEVRKPFFFNGIKCAIIICSDCGIRGLYPVLRRQGFEYRFCPTAGGGAVASMLHESDLDTAEGRKVYEEQRARVCNTSGIVDLSENQGIGFASANALGPVGRRTCHMGHCMIADNRGILRAQIPGTPVLEHQQDRMVDALIAFD